MIPKCYMATVTTHLTPEEIEFIKKPFELDGYMLKPFDAELVGYTMCGEAKSTIVKFTLYEGRNREIRNICASRTETRQTHTHFRRGLDTFRAEQRLVALSD